MAITGKDRMQVAAFHTIYRALRRTDTGYQDRYKYRTREEDFCEAIAVTSDDRLKDADPAFVKLWLSTFDNKGTRSSRRRKE